MIKLIAGNILPTALSLLPERMDTPLARRYILAIGLQESGFLHRRQIGGPAKSFFQFETSGVIGVMRHPATGEHLLAVTERLKYTFEPAALHAAIEHNDVLACVFARLNLWWLPEPLVDYAEGAWKQYVDSFRPGKPRHESWAHHWETAGQPDLMPDRRADRR